jgi:hypothetical protein
MKLDPRQTEAFKAHDISSTLEERESTYGDFASHATIKRE